MEEGTGLSKASFHKLSRSLSLQSHLLALPSELLIQEILSCLPLSSVIACSQTCKFIRILISFSPLLEYLKELTIAGMLHNSLCSYTSYPITERLSLLRERERRWMYLDPQWTRQVDVRDPEAKHHLYDIVPGHLLFGVTKRGVPCAVSSLKIPNELEGQIIWEEPADLGHDVGRCILNFGMALEEHNLIACLTCVEFANSATIEVHLISPSTSEHHPSARIPVLSVPTPYLQPLFHVGLADPTAWGDITISGENLAVSLKYPAVPYSSTRFLSRLYIWNWKSGISKGQFDIDLGNNFPGLASPNLTFLREDILLHPNECLNSLDIYHIPHSPLASGSEVRKVSQFSLPRLAKYFPDYHIRSHLSPSPRSSSTWTPQHIHADKPFINDPERSILGLTFNVFNIDRWVSFFLLVRWQYLLTCCLETISPNANPTGPASTANRTYQIYTWDEWGPGNSRLVPVSYYPVFMMTTAGSRWVSLTGENTQANSPRTLEVYDFDGTRVRIATQQAVTVKLKDRTTRVLRKPSQFENEDDSTSDVDARPQIELVDSTSPNVYPATVGIFAEEVYTCLPYLRMTYIKNGSAGGQSIEEQKATVEQMEQLPYHGDDEDPTPKSNPTLGADANMSEGEADGEAVPNPSPFPDLQQWQGILVDDERIIGLNFGRNGEGGRLDILYLG